MNSFPVIARELLVGGRRPATYRQRVIAATAAVGVMALIFMFQRPSTSNADLSQRLFISVSILGFVYAILAGVFLTSDCICSERREGTLPLLFLTRLNGFDVALGKLFSTSLVSSYTLLAILPILGLPVIMGGVTGGEFARICLALILTLLFSLTTGLLCSTVCRDTRSAMSSTFGILLVLTGVLYIPLWALDQFGGFQGAGDLYAITPMGAFTNAFDAYHRLRAGPQRYWTSIFCMAGLALAQFTAASLLVRRFQLPPEAKTTSLRLAKVTRRPIRANPYEWLLLRDRCPSLGVWLVVLLLVAIWGGCLLGSLSTASRNLVIPMFISTMLAAFALHVLVKGVVITQASRRLAEDRQSGALELLLSTPLPPREIVEGHRRALWLQFRGLLGLLLFVNLSLTVATIGWRNQLHMGHDDQFVFCSFFIGGALLLLMDFFLIPWVAMSEALRGRRQPRAVLSTVMHGLAPSWLALFGFVFVGMGINLNSEIVATFFWVWAIGSTLFVLVVALNRKLELRRQFRVVAAGDREWREPSPPALPPMAQRPSSPPVINPIRG